MFVFPSNCFLIPLSNFQSPLSVKERRANRDPALKTTAFSHCASYPGNWSRKAELRLLSVRMGHVPMHNR